MSDEAQPEMTMQPQPGEEMGSQPGQIDHGAEESFQDQRQGQQQPMGAGKTPFVAKKERQE